jgi:hypothetical protein
VPHRFRILNRFIVLCCLSLTTAAQGQILRDTTSLNLLKKGVDCIYNSRFDDARLTARKLNNTFPEHPVVHLLNGLIIYWENYPLIPPSPACNSYENEMRECIRLCEAATNPQDYAEYLLSNLGARGMLLEYYADNNLSENLIPLAKTTYHYIRKSFDYSAIYDDFYFFTGLYNYYREAYPDAHPIYKVVAFMFPKGDKDKGLQQMLIAANHSIMLKAEAYTFLSYIFIQYENNFQQAYIYSKSLYELYPSNLLYLATYLKNMLLVKKYNEAENIIRSFGENILNPYFQAQISIFNGILQEKKYHNNLLAKNYYNKGITDLSAYGYYGYEYISYGYFGLSRLSDLNEDKRNKKTYRKKALELTNYKKINFDD